MMMMMKFVDVGDFVIVPGCEVDDFYLLRVMMETFLGPAALQSTHRMHQFTLVQIIWQQQAALELTRSCKVKFLIFADVVFICVWRQIVCQFVLFAILDFRWLSLWPSSSWLGGNALVSIFFSAGTCIWMLRWKCSNVLVFQKLYAKHYISCISQELVSSSNASGIVIL